MFARESSVALWSCLYASNDACGCYAPLEEVYRHVFRGIKATRRPACDEFHSVVCRTRVAPPGHTAQGTYSTRPGAGRPTGSPPQRTDISRDDVELERFCVPTGHGHVGSEVAGERIGCDPSKSTTHGRIGSITPRVEAATAHTARRRFAKTSQTRLGTPP